MSSVNQFNELVNTTHNNHYINSPTGLIDVSSNASPNGNLIHHLYSNGEITFQKGAWAYLQRSEFNLHYKLDGSEKLNFQFAKKLTNNISYAILTEEECLQFREKMIELIKVHNDNIVTKLNI